MSKVDNLCKYVSYYRECPSLWFKWIFFCLWVISFAKFPQKLQITCLLTLRQRFLGLILASNYMFKVNNKKTRTKCEICSKLIIKTPVRRHNFYSPFYMKCNTGLKWVKWRKVNVTYKWVFSLYVQQTMSLQIF